MLYIWTGKSALSDLLDPRVEVTRRDETSREQLSNTIENVFDFVFNDHIHMHVM